MDHIICPYCECKVAVADVDDEGGVCPECGALVTGSMLMDHDGDDEEGLDDDADDDGGLSLDDDEDDFDDDGKPRRRKKH